MEELFSLCCRYSHNIQHLIFSQELKHCLSLFAFCNISHLQNKFDKNNQQTPCTFVQWAGISRKSLIDMRLLSRDCPTVWKKDPEHFWPVPDSNSQKRSSQLQVRGWHSSKNAPILANPGWSRVCEHVRYPGNNLLERSGFLIPPQKVSNRQEHEIICPTPHPQLNNRGYRNVPKVFCQLITEILFHIAFPWGH